MTTTWMKRKTQSMAVLLCSSLEAVVVGADVSEFGAVDDCVVVVDAAFDLVSCCC